MSDTPKFNKLVTEFVDTDLSESAYNQKLEQALKETEQELAKAKENVSKANRIIAEQATLIAEIREEIRLWKAAGY